MRIVAGAARGRRLLAPRGTDVRPTADRVKEALFSSLQPNLVGAHVADVYAGSGALGLEALSRGAKQVTFVERDRRAIETILRNIDIVDLPGTQIERKAALAALQGAPAGAPFDVVLVDPPYRLDADALNTVLTALVAHLAPGAVVVVERGVREQAPRWPEPMQGDDPRRYGDTVLYRATLPVDRGPATNVTG